MPFTESVYIALFIVAVVFSVLFGLFLCIRLISAVLMKKNEMQESCVPLPEPETVQRIVEDTSSGEVVLYNVDDRTAAMIMAIVADESGIPLPELRFKSIRLLLSGQPGGQNQG